MRFGIFFLLFAACSWTPPAMMPEGFPLWRGTTYLEEGRDHFIINVYDSDSDGDFDLAVWSMITEIDPNTVGVYRYPYRVEHWKLEALMIKRWTDFDVDGQVDLYEVLDKGKWRDYHFSLAGWQEIIR